MTMSLERDEWGFVARSRNGRIYKFTTRKEIIAGFHILICVVAGVFFFLWLESADVNSRVRLLESAVLNCEDKIDELKYNHL